MPDYTKFKSAMKMLQEYAAEFDEPSPQAVGTNDGGPSTVADLAPEVDSEPKDDTKRKAKIASYGAMLKKRMGM